MRKNPRVSFRPLVSRMGELHYDSPAIRPLKGKLSKDSTR